MTRTMKELAVFLGCTFEGDESKTAQTYPAALKSYRQATENHCNADGEHCDAREPTNSLSPRDDLFDQHHDRQARDPDQVHDPEDEQERHQHSAAAKTIKAVRQPETRGAEEARAPQPHEERERRAAFLETGGLERGQLIEAGRDQKRPSDAFVAECEPHLGNRADRTRAHWSRATSAEKPPHTTR